MHDVRLVVTEDHPEVRELMRTVMSAQSSLLIVGEATCGREALRVIAATLPDVALLDLSMSDVGGLEVSRRIKRDHPEVRIVFLSAHDEPQYVVEALRAGGCGYVLKESIASDLITAIETSMEGRCYISPSLETPIPRDVFLPG